MHADLQQVYVSVGCNKVVGALSWGSQGLIAYAAHNLVVLYDAEDAQIKATLLGHSARVNCVQWLPEQDSSCQAVASGAVDNNIIVWLYSPGQPEQPWKIAATLQAHTGPITALAQTSLGNTQLLFSIAEDQQLCIWECPLDAAQPQGSNVYSQWKLRQQLTVSSGLQHCLAVSHLPDQPDCLVVAVGGVDCSIRLLLGEGGQGFQEVCCLMGHADWVRSLAFSHWTPPHGQQQLMLASASQDKYLRVWRIQPEPAKPSSSGSESQKTQDLAASIARYAPKPRFKTPRKPYTASLEALLVGHEDWVHSVQWQPPTASSSSSQRAKHAQHDLNLSQQDHQQDADGEADAMQVQQQDAQHSSLDLTESQHAQRAQHDTGAEQPLCLLSTSMDRTMMLWRPDPATGVWMSEESVGDAGATNLGYFTGCFSPDGRSTLAHGFTGALHLWTRPEGVMQGAWEPKHAVGGHYGAVVDMCWGMDGSCLLTASTDQTCRITTQSQGHWCQLARPQVHGHDMSCVADIPNSSCYVSGAEEKVLRVFEAPQTFNQTLALAQGRAAPSTDTPSQGHQGNALGAAVAALGLSNKAVFADQLDETNAGVASGMEGGGYTEGPDLAPNAMPSAVSGAPLEEHLAQSSLWPEIAKLYGHGAELFCLAASPSGDLVASACKAQTSTTAAIWLWDTKRWTAIGSLTAHGLTITQLQFSPNGQRLLSVSRDRTFAVYDRVPGEMPFKLAHRVKAHARIIWGASWTHDGAYFATASRDGSIKLWHSNSLSDKAKPVYTMQLKEPVVAIAFAPTSAEAESNRNYSLAVGLATGAISVWCVSCSTLPADGSAAKADAKRIWECPVATRHCASVRRLCWRQQVADECDDHGEERSMYLASCGDDHCVRIFSVSISA